ncbi:hypothetical protein OU800_22040 [Pseudomonas sp. GOM7]|uniref:hypothetical protein n=1 Tax=Pseudomonas sp. GOM7 TaxID=2998079 RepID=UPI00227C49B7|nr:hypothetical protein [Pseudomonas sp. GOM7]WAJ37256.1 hypothetical protein OU800_22040 [Pseudomonas sp. GOM7]
MSKKRISTATALLVALQLGQLGWLGWFQYDKSAATSRQQEQLTQTSAELDGLRAANTELAEAVSSLKGTTNAQLSSLDTKVAELKQLADSLGASQVDTLELRVVLAAKVEQLVEDVTALKRIPASLPQPAAPAIPTPVKSPPKKRPAPAARIAKAKPKLASPPPFVLLGIETRAGEPFASIARDGAASLGDVQLLRPGEAYQSWKLIRVEDRAAVFSAGGEERVVSIR